MKKRISFFIIVAILVVTGVIFLFHGTNVDVLNPKGIIAEQQRNLIVFTVLLSLVVVVPVFTLLAVISWKYRASNTKAKYKPDWDHNVWLEALWWGIPCAIILVLSFVTWQSSHDLDPFKPLNSSVKPIKVQVVALQWKWLFIYPDYNIASVNELRFPSKTPVNFTITADAPMNSFWIPSLGGQVYAMSGMSTELHLMANDDGTYSGSSANISGQGFADMNFKAISTSQTKFETWAKQVQVSDNRLDQAAYDELAKPGAVKNPGFYALSKSDLYDSIVIKYMSPSSNKSQTSAAPTAGDSTPGSMSDMPMPTSGGGK